ncbi:MAG: ATP-binding protein [Gammaproteobacteria bacterium]|nr:ATP-binding protein [Gammaproteobacteria bacterium]MDH5653788.1 ATP-binding protein [Gammaproteobacteria bacterium]
MKQLHRYSRHSLSGKLTLLFIGMIILIVLLMSNSMRHVFRNHFNDHIRPHLLQYLEYVQNDIGLPPDRDKARRLADELHIEIIIQDKAGTWSSDGRHILPNDIRVRHTQYEQDIEYAIVEIADNDNYLRIKRGDITLYFGIPLSAKELHARSFIPLLFLILVLILLYHATRRLFAPIEIIRNGVQAFSAGNLDHRIDVKRQDELGELAVSFNNMAGEINKMLEAKRQLLLAISHELRSPLTRSKIAVELLENPEQRSRLHRDLDEMEKLIEELLETERLSTPHRVLNPSACNIQSLIQELIHDFYREQHIQLIFPDHEIKINVDAARLKLLLKNLLDNALRYSPVDKPVTLSVATEPGRLVIRVKDQGEGIDSKHIPHLTEPFYRVDPARQRETGGYGLGLYLCRMIAEAHKGDLLIESAAGRGTTITLVLPYTTNN